MNKCLFCANPVLQTGATEAYCFHIRKEKNNNRKTLSVSLTWKVHCYNNMFFHIIMWKYHVNMRYGCFFHFWCDSNTLLYWQNRLKIRKQIRAIFISSTSTSTNHFLLGLHGGHTLRNRTFAPVILQNCPCKPNVLGNASLRIRCSYWEKDTGSAHVSGGNAVLLRENKMLTYEQILCWTRSLKSFPHNFWLHKNLMHDFNMTKWEYTINSTFKKSQLLYFFFFQ